MAKKPKIVRRNQPLRKVPHTAEDTGDIYRPGDDYSKVPTFEAANDLSAAEAATERHNEKMEDLEEYEEAKELEEADRERKRDLLMQDKGIEGNKAAMVKAGTVDIHSLSYANYSSVTEKYHVREEAAEAAEAKKAAKRAAKEARQERKGVDAPSAEASQAQAEPDFGKR